MTQPFAFESAATIGSPVWGSGDLLARVAGAIADARVGRPVLIRGTDPSDLLWAVSLEYPARPLIDSVPDGAPSVVISARRLSGLGLRAATDVSDAPVTVLRFRTPFDRRVLASLADPMPSEAALAELRGELIDAVPGPAGSAAEAAVMLAKAARLLPTVCVVDAAGAAPKPGRGAGPEQGCTAPRCLDVADMMTYPEAQARSLRIVAQAQVPLAGAENTRIVAFRPGDGGFEHLAIIVGTPDLSAPVLVRLHSECLTGDLLGSLRCDCGDQLRGAIRTMAEAGAGIVLYLAQEGRGIGLVNKLRAYQLQDRGLDTLDANGQLGFEDDERLYLPAVEMLRQLGVSRVRLLTNNPLKVEALKQHGVDVVDRVRHAFSPNAYNRVYLETKARRSGHLL